jgi:hypothetical protein
MTSQRWRRARVASVGIFHGVHQATPDNAIAMHGQTRADQSAMLSFRSVVVTTPSPFAANVGVGEKSR